MQAQPNKFQKSYSPPPLGHFFASFVLLLQVCLKKPRHSVVELLASAPGFSGIDFNSLKTTQTVRRCGLDVLSWQRLSRFRSLPTVENVPSRHAALPNFDDNLACKIKRQQLDVLFNPMRQFHPSPLFSTLPSAGWILPRFTSAVNQSLRQKYQQPFHGDHGSGSSSMGGHSIGPAN